MKLSLVPLGAMAVIAVLLSSCISIDPGAIGGSGGNQDAHDHDDGDRFGPKSYAKGQKLGYQDGLNGLSESHGRHRDAYNPRYKSSFCEGYHEGYARGHAEHERQQQAEHDHDDQFGGAQAWYNSGLALGRRDRREGESDNYRRHQTHYDERSESQFALGYYEGYTGKPKRE